MTTKIASQRVKPHILESQLGAMKLISLAPTASLTNPKPISGSITAAQKAFSLYKSLHQHRSISVASSKILRQLPPAASQNLQGRRPKANNSQEPLAYSEKVTHQMRTTAQLSSQVMVTFQQRVIECRLFRPLHLP